MEDMRLLVRNMAKIWNPPLTSSHTWYKHPQASLPRFRNGTWVPVSTSPQNTDESPYNDYYSKRVNNHNIILCNVVLSTINLTRRTTYSLSGTGLHGINGLPALVNPH